MENKNIFPIIKKIQLFGMRTFLIYNWTTKIENGQEKCAKENSSIHVPPYTIQQFNYWVEWLKQPKYLNLTIFFEPLCSTCTYVHT